jgi:hypothetical protein
MPPKKGDQPKKKKPTVEDKVTIRVCDSSTNIY